MNEIALIGKKIGMTREFYKSGQLVPVTIIKMEKARVIQVIEKEKRGYMAVQRGYGKIKNSKLSKAMKGYFTKKNTEAKKKLKEYRISNVENFKEGNEFGLEISKDVKFVDTKSKTIGKGFAGAMKRHNFGGLRALNPPKLCLFIAPAKPLPIVFDLVSTNFTSLEISNPNSFPSLKFSTLEILYSLSFFFASVFFFVK